MFGFIGYIGFITDTGISGEKVYKGCYANVSKGEATVKREVAIISVSRNGRITIPEELREELEIRDGDKMRVCLRVEEGEKMIFLEKIH